MNIWIPSKGRPNPLASKLLSSAGVEHTIIVEPQDYDKYAAVLSKHAYLHTLPINDGGLTYVRQYLLDQARDLGGVPYWVMDDDIKNIFPTEMVKGKLRRVKGSGPDDIRACMEAMSSLFESNEEIAYASPCNAAALWRMGEGLSMDSVHFSFNWVHSGRIHQDTNYRGGAGQCDLTFAAEVILSGGRVAVDLHVGADHSPMGTAAKKSGLTGGLQDCAYNDWQNIVNDNKLMEELLNNRRDALLQQATHLSAKQKETIKKWKLIKWYMPTWGEGETAGLRYATLRKIWLETRER